MGHPRHQKIIIILFIFGVILAACESRNQAQNLISEVTHLKAKEETKPATQSTPAIKRPIEYKPAARKPFKEVKTQSEGMVQRDPLQRYSLDALTLIGVMQFDDKNYALVSTPDKLVFQVDQKMAIGENDGHIVEFGLDYIKVKEKPETPNAPERVITLQIKDNQ